MTQMSTDLNALNDKQKNAVLESIDNNVILLAGAGSGKTRVLVTRTEYLIKDKGIHPSNIMMITFTNKAANEILQRVSTITNDAHKMWIGTFHKICTRIIRMFGDRIGIKSFTIIDQKAAKDLIKDIAEDMGFAWTPYMANMAQTKISEYKTDLIKPSKVMDHPKYQSDANIVRVYKQYQDTCWRRKSFDFDDLIIYAILLLSSYPDVAEWIHNHIKYISVDEMQDTNTCQYQLIRLIAGNNNLMLVGDVQQSIYGFRNAKPQYLVEFQKLYPNSKKLYLTQNYRSTKTIINAANAVINHNVFGDKIVMDCNNVNGNPIAFCQLGDNYQEARWVAAEILTLVNSKHFKYSDCAVIYRANFQSRVLEEILMSSGVPYVVFGSMSFYSRKEVRDLLSFCKVIINEYDIDSFKRILGTIKGCGKVTVNTIVDYVSNNNLSCKQGIQECIDNEIVKPRGKATLTQMVIFDKILKNNYNKCSEIVKDVLNNTDYKTDLEYDPSEEAKQRLEIIQEFVQMLESIEIREPNTSMAEIIDQVSLLSDIKSNEKENANTVKLMTAHASKGLEFTNVFVIGVEEGLFPHSNAINASSNDAIEEERRLFYVAMTRAMKNLYLTRAISRKSENGNVITTKSRFFKEIPENLIEETF